MPDALQAAPTIATKSFGRAVDADTNQIIRVVTYPIRLVTVEVTIWVRSVQRTCSRSPRYVWRRQPRTHGLEQLYTSLFYMLTVEKNLHPTND